MKVQLSNGELKVDSNKISIYDEQIFKYKKEVFAKMLEFDGDYNITEVVRYHQGIGEPKYFNISISMLLQLLMCADECYYKELYDAIISILAKLSSLDNSVFTKKEEEVLPSYFC